MDYKMDYHDIKSIIVWGCGDYFWGNLWRIDPNINILFVVDSVAEEKKYLCKSKGFDCMYPNEIEKYPDIPILIAVRNKSAFIEISDELHKKGREYFYIDELIKSYSETAEYNQVCNYNSTFKNICEPVDKNILKYFLSVSVPVKACNLKCEYCYINHHGGVENNDIIIPSAEYIQKALSRKRLGGTALINFCGVGETLLCRELPQIVKSLLLEGHYVSIITNATLRDEIDKYINIEKEYKEKIFFKCSLHYLQLKEKKLLEIYADNVQTLRNNGISISVEVVPNDLLEPYIEELKEYCMQNFGALPHLSVPRDERNLSLALMSRHSERDFFKIWSDFNSDMFNMKMKERQKRSEYCYAGKYAGLLELDTGNIRACPFEPIFSNIYEDLSKKIVTKAVGQKCNSAYCFNGHAYLTLGMIKEWNDYSYLDIRDRKCKKWGTWVTPIVAEIFNQRICDNI